MKNFVVIADQDRGKTFFVKNEILKKFHNRKNYIYDINLEYSEFKNELKFLPTKEEFLKVVPMGNQAAPSKCNVIFEEATSFFSRGGVTESALNLHIFRRFHSQNINVFVFHGLNFVPLDILTSIDYFVIFRTSDSENLLQKKFGTHPIGQKLLSAWHDVMQKTEGTKFNRELKNYPDEKSKQFFHYKRIIDKNQ